MISGCGEMWQNVCIFHAFLFNFLLFSTEPFHFIFEHGWKIVLTYSKNGIFISKKLHCVQKSLSQLSRANHCEVTANYLNACPNFVFLKKRILTTVSRQPNHLASSYKRLSIAHEMGFSKSQSKIFLVQSFRCYTWAIHGNKLWTLAHPNFFSYSHRASLVLHRCTETKVKTPNSLCEIRKIENLVKFSNFLRAKNLKHDWSAFWITFLNIDWYYG